MPTVRVGDSEGEGLTGAISPVRGAAGEVARVSSNLTLADHVGKYIAGEVAGRYRNENLADSLKGKNAIHVSFSWG